MDLTSPKKIKELLKEMDTRPIRQRGQNFLADKKVLARIVEAAQLTETDFAFEVGAGLGTLTQELAVNCAGVFTVEIDSTLTKILAKTVGPYKNVYLFKGDVLSRDCFAELEKWKNKNSVAKFKIVANLPYQITSIFLREYLPRDDWQLAILMIQKEVAQRIIAPAGETSMLSLSVQYFSKPTIVRMVSKNSFWPSPEVDSAVISLDPGLGYKKVNNISAETEEKAFRLMRMGFAARRKQLHNNLAGGTGLSSDQVRAAFVKIGLKEQVRAQELTLADWFKLVELIG